MELQYLEDDELWYELALRQISVTNPDRMELLEQELRRERKREVPPPSDASRLTRQTVRKELADCDAKLTVIAFEIHQAMQEMDEQMLTRSQSRLQHIDGRIRRLWAFAPEHADVQQLMARAEEVNQHISSAHDSSGAGESALDASLAAVVMAEPWPPTNHRLRRSVTPAPAAAHADPSSAVEGGASALSKVVSEAHGGAIPKVPPASVVHRTTGLPSSLLMPLVSAKESAVVPATAHKATPKIDELLSLDHSTQQRPAQKPYQPLNWVPLSDDLADELIGIAVPAAQGAHPGSEQSMSKIVQLQEALRQAIQDERDQRQRSFALSQVAAPSRGPPAHNAAPFAQTSVFAQQGGEPGASQAAPGHGAWQPYAGGAPRTNDHAQGGVRPPGDGAGQRMHQWSLRFDGREGGLPADDFIFRVERQAQLYGVAPGSLVIGFALLLQGKAEEWYWTYQRQYRNATWRQLRDAFIERYAPYRESDYDIRAKMDQRRQRPGERFGDFCQDVEVMSVRLAYPMSQGELVEMLRRNMNMTLRKALWRINTASVDVLRAECAEYERQFKAADDHRMQLIRNAKVHEIQHVEERYSQVPVQQETWDEFESCVHVDAVQQGPPNRHDLVICWNCKDIGHAHAQCPVVQTRLFCYTCGAEGITSKDCSRCSLNGPKTGMAAQSRSSQQRPPIQIARHPASQHPAAPATPTIHQANQASNATTAPRPASHPNAFRTTPQ